MSAIELEAHYKSWASLHRDVQQQLQRGGLLLRTSAELQQFSPLRLTLVAPSGESFELDGQVLQVIPGQGVAMQLGGEAGAELARLRETCEENPPEGAPEADDPLVEQPTRRTGARLQLSLDPQELRRQLEGMTVNEKRQAALGGRREARLLLIRDMNKAVHPFVLKNPSITIDEVEAFAKMPSINPDALRMIALNREWVRSASICRNLVRNPKTPLREALLLLEKLPIGEVRALAKSGNVRMPIQVAARKKINAPG